MTYFKNLLFKSFLAFALVMFYSCEEDTTDDMKNDDDTENNNTTEGPSELSIVIPFAGTYNVTSDPDNVHDRETITIGSDGSVDFDTNVSFSAADAQAVYDRIECCKRIQISYGADDDGEVINLFLNESASAVTSIQFRHNNQSIDIEVSVEKQ